MAIGCNNGSTSAGGTVSMVNEQDSVSYAFGVLLASQINEVKAKDSINTDIVLTSINNFVKSENVQMGTEDAQMFLQEYFMEKEKQQFGGAIEEGQQFMADYATQEGVQITDSGLAFKYIKKGKGATPTIQDAVKCKYKGMFTDRMVFEETENPIEFDVYGVIPGWTEMVQLMKEGDRVEVAIPYDLAYGERGAGSIPPYSTLLFEIELVEVIKK